MKWILFIFCCVASRWVCAGDFQLFEEDGRVGLKNEQGVVLLPASFDGLGWSDGSFSVIGEITGYKLNGKWGLINLKKEFVTQAEFESLIYSGADRVVAVKKISNISQKTGSLTLSGAVTIPFQYDAVKIYGLRAVVMNKVGTEYQFGLTDLNNKNLIPVKFSNIYPVSSIRFAVRNKQSKLALFSDAGKQTTDFFIDSISPFHRSFAVIHSNGLKGIINRDGIVVSEPLFSDIKLSGDGSVQALSQDQWKILDDHNQTTQSLKADHLDKFQKNSYRITRGGKVGVINTAWQEIWPIEYEYIGTVINEHIAVKKNRKWGLLSADRAESVPFEYDSMIWDGQFAKVLTIDVGKPKWWIINPALNAKSKSYDAITKWDDLFLVKRNGFAGLLNLEGREIVHCVYDSIVSIKKQQVVVRFKNHYGIISQDEHWLLGPQPFPIQIVNDSLYLLTENDITFLKSFNGNIIYFTDYKLSVEPFYLLEKSPSGDFKRIDFNGVQIKSLAQGVSVRGLPSLEPPVNDGLRIFSRDGKFGFRDSWGTLRIPNRYDSVKSFSNQLAAFKLLGRWGYLDTEDNMVVHPTYNYAGEFLDGFAIVSRNGKMGLIDKTGNVNLALEYDRIERSGDFLKLIDNGKTGLARLNGKLLIEPRFDFLQILPNDQVIVRLRDRFGVITIDGLNIIPTVYTSLEYDDTKNLYLAHVPSEWTTLKLPKNE